DHLYLVRRTITGQSATVRASAEADGSQVSEGATDTRRYVHSVLGMDDVSFRASVFAEQRQLAAFSSTAPAERRRLVLGLLGITPLDGARDQARKDSREAHKNLDKLRGFLADTDQLSADLEHAEKTAVESGALAQQASAAASASEEMLEKVQKDHDRLAELDGTYHHLVGEGKRTAEEHKGVADRIERLRKEEEELAVLQQRLGVLDSRSAGAQEAEEQLRVAREVLEAQKLAAEIPLIEEPPARDPGSVAEAREMAAVGKEQVDKLQGAKVATAAESQRATKAFDAATALSGGEDCPLCGQALGDAFEKVQAHRAEEVSYAHKRLAELDRDLEAAHARAREAADRERQALKEQEVAEKAWAAYDTASSARAQAGVRVTAAERAADDVGLGTCDIAKTVDKLSADLRARHDAGEEAAKVRGRLERQAAVQQDISELARLAESLDAEIHQLREKVRDLNFRQDDLVAARAAREGARAKHRLAIEEAKDAARTEAAATARADAEAKRLGEAKEQHQKAEKLSEDARHLARTAELLDGFRNTVVASVGPRLSAQAAELFSELTDHEYDRLEVEPNTYEIQIRDQGSVYGMDRFSGSETDLANLALRVAISEQVRFQSGGAVGLLVLDEVFGPLDDDRKVRMLSALERLRG
ncbi:MAG: hypothetical protein ACRD1G_03935, partial [Acidimicrobiales bacterium]